MNATKNEVVTISGHVYDSAILGNKGQRYMNVTLPFRDIKDIVTIEQYNASTGRGVQRGALNAHQNKLAKAMENNSYTPAPFTAMLRSSAAKSLVVDNKGFANIEFIRGKDSLVSLDGSQRNGSLQKLLDSSEDETAKESVLNMPIPLIVLLDGSAKEHFLNANSGKAIDTLQTMVMKAKGHIGQKKGMGDVMAEAVNMASLMNKDKNSPFYNLIRMDVQSNQAIKATTLMSTGSSDIGTSLVGLAKITAKSKVEREVACGYVTSIFDAFSAAHPTLIEHDRPLAAPNVGSKGAATMWIGLGNLLAYAAYTAEECTDEMVGLLVSCAYDQFKGEKIQGSFTSAYKREKSGAIAKEFFAGSEEDNHEGVPLGLVTLLSASTFGLSKYKKAEEAAEAEEAVAQNS